MRAFSLAASVPWAIRPEALRTILEIAARENLTPEAVAAQLGRPLDNTRTVKMREAVAVIPVEGPIFRYANLFTQISGATSIEVLARDFQAALTDPAVAAIVLAIDSPGGEVNGVAEFAEMVYAARGRKPIIAYVSHEGASAAYWIASSADAIVAATTAELGCIGVVATVADPTAKSAKEIVFVSSQSPDKRPDPTTESGRAVIQGTVDALADIFVATVARNRGVDADKVLADYGMGWVKVGQAGVDAGLADRLGSFEGLIEELTAAHKMGGRISSPYFTGGQANGTPTPKTAATAANERGNPMGLKERLIAIIANAEDEPEVATATATPPASTATRQAPPEAAQPPAPDPRITQLEAEVARLNAARIAAEATGFADAEIVAGRAFPAEREVLIAAFAQAASDDLAHGVLAAAEGAPTSRTAQLKAVYAARPAHNLTQEAIPAGAHEALLNRQQTQRGKNEPAPAAEMDQLLAATSLGRAVLADRKNGHN